MSKLISNCAKAEMNECVMKILCVLVMSAWYSELTMSTKIWLKIGMLPSRPPPIMLLDWPILGFWQYVCLLMNHLTSTALGWKSPEQVLTGSPPEISNFLHFSFYESMYYNS
jgi:hypothetical protein